MAGLGSEQSDPSRRMGAQGLVCGGDIRGMKGRLTTTRGPPRPSACCLPLPCGRPFLGGRPPRKQGVGNLHSLLLSTDFPLVLPNASHLSTFLRARPLRISSLCGEIFTDSKDYDTPSL